MENGQKNDAKPAKIDWKNDMKLSKNRERKTQDSKAKN